MPFIYFDGRDNAAYEPTGESRDGRPIYCVTASFGYLVRFGGKLHSVNVPNGFLTDLASIPSLPFMPKPGGSLWDDAAIVHDVACIEARKGIRTRREADAIFYHALRERGCRAYTAWVFWAAVRIGSLSAAFQ